MDQPIHHSIRDLYIASAKKHGNSPAILSEDGLCLTYNDLAEFCLSTKNTLEDAGINAHDRIALCLPNGPMMALAFLSVTSCAACAPLNPVYKKDEFLNYIEDLQCTALLILKDDSSPAREAAHDLGLVIIEITPHVDHETCGKFNIASFKMGHKATRTAPEGQDIALLLHTSGTTSRPKIVPLSHNNLLHSVRNIVASLQLNPQDRALNVMPLFHIHGIMVCLLSPLATGGSVICTKGVNAPHISQWLEILKPSWYSAVPTMHQAMLRTLSNIPPARRHQWRLIRSSSAALPPSLLDSMIEHYQCPVIEAYGMTEASHLMSSNPLPPGKIKSGSVGKAAGPDVALLSDGGSIIHGEGQGEVIIQGRNVMKAYENNPTANSENFIGNWFRTGDLGEIDGDGYLSLTGRIKEMINCGGEKIMPREIDEVLLDHDAIREAVTFAAPHNSLGEQPAAALVLETGKTLNKEDVISFVGQQLGPVKVPQIVIFLDELPKGPTGKLQRIGLAEILLKPAPEVKNTEIMTETESDIQNIWRIILEQDGIRLDDRFLENGGDSLSAIEVMIQIEERHDIRMPLDDLLELPTIRLLAEYVDLQK